MGAGIPALTLGMSYLTGSLLTQQGLTVLTYAAGALVLCVLTVSLTHVAEAISTITGAPSWMAWALAIAVDASLVCSEVTQVTAGIAPAVCYTIIGCVAFVSAALNMFAFKLSQDRRACIR